MAFNILCEYSGN